MPPTAEDMPVDEDAPVVITPSSIPCDPEIQINIVTALGIPALVQVSLPSLLFADMDERPSWLLTSISDHLQYSPYYLCLNNVVDLFLKQEARLGYPVKVQTLQFSFIPSLTLCTATDHSPGTTIS